MKHADFSLYTKKEKDGVRMWYAKFWNHDEKKFTAYRSLKVTVSGVKLRRGAAHKAATAMLAAMRPLSHGPSFAECLDAFWAEGGAYETAFKRENQRALAEETKLAGRGVVKNHVFDYEPFTRLSPQQVTPQIIRDYIEHLGKKNLCAPTIYNILKKISPFTRYLYENEQTASDPFDRVKFKKPQSGEKGVLSKNEVARLMTAVTVAPEAKSAVMLGALCGLRLGEVRGLKSEDVKGDHIAVSRQWQTREGEKSPKYDSAGDVPLPSPLKTHLAKTGAAQSGYIFPGRLPGKPAGEGKITRYFKDALETIGISAAQQKARNITFHSLRHTFVTHSRAAGLSLIEVQTLARHKSLEQTEHYSHGNQIIDVRRATRVETKYWEEKPRRKKGNVLKKK